MYTAHVGTKKEAIVVKEISITEVNCVSLGQQKMFPQTHHTEADIALAQQEKLHLELAAESGNITVITAVLILKA